jgi:EAL domain-containing protein (putative c-di-GMP-specific phosphodiesterase class I)
MSSRKILPYFQPIIAADTNEIYSYEVLGRYIDDDGAVKSLGSFFSNDNVSGADVLKVDRIVRKRALEQYAGEGLDKYLFVNLRLEWIANYADRPEEMPTVMWAREFGIDFSRLVIEITEEEFNADNETLTRLMSYYKKIGCRIAVDDFGDHASNIDRLAMLSPDILKINMSYIHRSEESYHYHEYMKAITSFAERVGIEVLYEGVETEKQLDICIDSKGRYYQGFLLAKPQPSMLNPHVNFGILSTSSFRSIMALHEKAEYVNARRKFWDIRIERFLTENRFNIFLDDINDYFSKLFLEVSDLTKRIYLCNRRGEQLSYNIELDSENIKWNDYRRRNWAWRGFFQEAMIMLDAGMKSHLSAVYRDATTKEEIYTYTYAINTDLYLLIDILQSMGAGSDVQEDQCLKIHAKETGISS